jgi:hypothetical protein
MLECRMGKINDKNLRFEVLTLVTVFWLWLYSVLDTNVMEESSFSKNILFYWEALYKKSHTDERIILKFLKPSQQLKSVHFLICVRWLKGKKYLFYWIGYHWHVYDLGVLDYCIQWNIKDISETGSVSPHMWREGVPGDWHRSMFKAHVLKTQKQWTLLWITFIVTYSCYATWKSGISGKICRPFLAHIVPLLATRISSKMTSGKSWNF